MQGPGLSTPDQRPRHRLWAGALVFLLSAVWVFIYLAVPPWIAEDPARNLARLGLVGRKMNYEAFLHYWPRYHLAALLLVGVLVACLLFASTPLAQQWIDRAFGRAPVLDPVRDLGRRRLRLVVALWVLVLGPQLLAGVSGLEAWPFSPYGMYAARQGGSVSFPRIRVITPGTDVDMRDPAWLAPFDLSRLDFAIGRLIRQGDSTALAGAAQFALDRYEGARRRDSLTLPPAHGVAILRDTWILEEGAVNRARPDSSETLYQRGIR